MLVYRSALHRQAEVHGNAGLDVHVDGAKSGSHSGHLRAFSQGDGASFVPSSPFLAGESVNVRGHVRVGAHTHRFSYNFVVAHQDVHLYSAKAHVAIAR